MYGADAFALMNNPQLRATVMNRLATIRANVEPESPVAAALDAKINELFSMDAPVEFSNSFGFGANGLTPMAYNPFNPPVASGFSAVSPWGQSTDASTDSASQSPSFLSNMIQKLEQMGQQLVPNSPIRQALEQRIQMLKRQQSQSDAYYGFNTVIKDAQQGQVPEFEKIKTLIDQLDVNENANGATIVDRAANVLDQLGQAGQARADQTRLYFQQSSLEDTMTQLRALLGNFKEGSAQYTALQGRLSSMSAMSSMLSDQLSSALSSDPTNGAAVVDESPFSSISERMARLINVLSGLAR